MLWVRLFDVFSLQIWATEESVIKLRRSLQAGTCILNAIAAIDSFYSFVIKRLNKWLRASGSFV